MDLASTNEAAEKLGLHSSHVRRLIRKGQLPGRKVGGRWLVSEEALRRRERLTPPRGRPLSAEMAWRLLGLLDAALHDEAWPLGDRLAVLGSVHVLDDRRQRFRVRKTLAEAPPVESWASWLRTRATDRRVWVQPGVVWRLQSDKRLHPGGEVATSILGGIGLTGRTDRESVFYVHPYDVDTVVADYTGRDELSQILLKILPVDLSSVAMPTSGEPVGPAVGLVDLLGSDDAPLREAAAKLLNRAKRRIEELDTRNLALPQSERIQLEWDRKVGHEQAVANAARARSEVRSVRPPIVS